MFIAHNKVRMHDIDMAGILYFPRQFRFAHDALEELLEEYGLNFDEVFRKENRKHDFVFVIVHAEADYYKSLRVGDKLDIQLTVTQIGNTSFTLEYKIFRGQTLTGFAKTVHVTLDADSREKIPVPADFRKFLEKY